MSDTMPSETVPAQELSDAGDDLVRLAAAKDAEFAAYREKFEDLLEAWGITTTLPQEQALETLDDIIARAESGCADAELAAYEARQELLAAKAEIAALTEQRDEAIAHSDNDHSSAKAYRAGRDRATEQRDRAMAVVSWARRVVEVWYGGGALTTKMHSPMNGLRAALDAEAAAETEGT